MDDLLSVALAESGLDEYLSEPNSPFPESQDGKNSPNFSIINNGVKSNTNEIVFNSNNSNNYVYSKEHENISSVDNSLNDNIPSTVICESDLENLDLFLKPIEGGTFLEQMRASNSPVEPSTNLTPDDSGNSDVILNELFDDDLSNKSLPKEPSNIPANSTDKITNLKSLPEPVIIEPSKITESKDSNSLNVVRVKNPIRIIKKESILSPESTDDSLPPKLVPLRKIYSSSNMNVGSLNYQDKAPRPIPRIESIRPIHERQTQPMTVTPVPSRNFAYQRIPVNRIPRTTDQVRVGNGPQNIVPPRVMNSQRLQISKNSILGRKTFRDNSGKIYIVKENISMGQNNYPRPIQLIKKAKINNHDEAPKLIPQVSTMRKISIPGNHQSGASSAPLSPVQMGLSRTNGIFQQSKVPINRVGGNPNGNNSFTVYTNFNGAKKIIYPHARLQHNVIVRPPVLTEIQKMKANLKLANTKEEMKNALKMGAVKAKETVFEEEDESLGHAETYSEYKPAKLRSGNPHPDCVVETSSLSSVSPPEIRYHVEIPEINIDEGRISALQLEVVIYACQMHMNKFPNGERAGYLIGDGAGVGKGRTIASIIYENYLRGRKKALWLSVSSDLRWDTERDLRDIGATDIPVVPLNKLRYAKINGPENNNFKKGVIFATYSSLIGECRTAKSKYRTRLKQLLQWFGPDFDGLIVFDECHKAKNLCPTAGSKPTKTGKVVMELQKQLPNARIVYASATGATEPKNMAYMTRLGLWGKGQSFPEFNDFINAVEKRGVGAMELVAMDMKQRGLYLARQLSFRGVTFRVEEVALSNDFIYAYDESVKVWLDVRRYFQKALSVLSDDERVSQKLVWGQFWAAHQRFFKYLCIAAKVQACVNIAKEALKNNKCVVIGLQSTGEARTLEQLEENGGELTEFVSTAKAVIQGLIEKHFPTQDISFTGKYDIFSDFDKMLGSGNKSKKNNKRKKNPIDDFFNDFDNEDNTKNKNTAKRKRLESEHNETSEDESESDRSSIVSDLDIGGDHEAWKKLLLAEAETSDDEASDISDNDSESNSDTDDSSANNNEGSDSETDEPEKEDDAFNPFLHDFSANDPWADKQKVIEENQAKLSKAEEKEKRRLNKKKEKEREKKKKEKRRKDKQKRLDKIADIVRRKEEMASDAMKGSAEAFIQSSKIIDDDDIEVTANNLGMIKTELLAAVERLGSKLPPNTLDQLIDELGGPEFVAEMTGRKGRVVTKENGEIEYQQRHVGTDATVELMNVEEKHKFMKGEKLIAIISEAASSGISLQADRRAENTRRRVHITMELPWSADKAIQQFGRTHRSNQVSAPEYLFLISELAGEKRFASIVAKRLESLGALTHGDRRATESRDLSQFNLDNKYGRAALEVCLKSIVGVINPPFMNPPENYKPGNFFSDMRQYLEGVGILSVSKLGQYSVERDGNSIAKFLNRLLGLPVHAQNALFEYFTLILEELIRQAKYDGTYDMGIMDIGTGENKVQRLETRIFTGKLNYNTFRVEMHKIGVERGMSWEEALSVRKVHTNENDGFYISPLGALGKQQIVLLCEIGGKKGYENDEHLFSITKPQSGRIHKLERFSELTKRFKKISNDEAEVIWKNSYTSSATHCQHKYFHGKCKTEEAGTYCEVGRRTRTFFVLSGSVLSVWPIIEEVLSCSNPNNSSNLNKILKS
ncbi:Protein strawberry notch homolog 2 [Strongyloides ratti]|uniref:Protein strawberry notch homolog 2 n=1 Tax=Strongyloides ratti TaxID=34506 RepID=A0A090L1K8_STRRB|nr:Protein strawberry notch homolog 2 [Strongyloides ratti]CEF63666.1 Protein strawberry notch homolog 2 [Strongyloides ratti]